MHIIKGSVLAHVLYIDPTLYAIFEQKYSYVFKKLIRIIVCGEVGWRVSFHLQQILYT